MYLLANPFSLSIMMKKLYQGLLFLLIAFPLTSHARQAESSIQLDSLKNRLTQVKTDTSRAKVLQELSDSWIEKDSAKSMDYARQILTLEEAENNNYVRGIGHYQIGGVYMVYYQLGSAQVHHRKAIEFLQTATSRQAKQYLARTWFNYGAVYQREGDEKRFTDILLNEAIPILYSIKDTVGVGIDYIALGEVMMNNDEWEEADEYYRKAIDILSNDPDHKDLPRVHIRAARNLMLDENGDTPKQTKKIREHLDLASTYLPPDEESYTRVEYFTNKGMYYHYRKENTEKAVDNYARGMALAKKLRYNYALAALAFQKFRIYLDNEQFVKAKQAGYEAYQLQKEFSIPENWLMTLNRLVELEEKTGNTPKAYELLSRYVELSDSVRTEEREAAIIEMEKQYDAERKENEILQLQNANNRQQLQLQRTRLWIYLTGGIAMLLLGGGLAGFKMYRNRQQINQQKEQLHQQEITRLKQEQRLGNFSAMLEGQEQERKRIARELHDGLGGTISGIKLSLSQAIAGSNEQEEFPEIIDQLDHSVTELRRIAQNLMPETLLRYDLATALEDFCRNMQNDATHIVFQAYGVKDDSICQRTKIMLYRIVQELVTNAIKHANASSVLVQLTQNDSQLQLTVEDNGVGFDQDATNHKPGLGLSTVKTRVEYLKGELDFVSEPGTGTTVNMTMDVSAAAEAAKAENHQSTAVPIIL